MAERESNRLDQLRRIAERLKGAGDPRWERAQKLADLHKFGRPVVREASQGGSQSTERTQPVERQVFSSRTTQLPFYSVEENARQNRLQIRFAAVVDAEVKQVLKDAGFRRSPSANAWQRPLDKGGLAAVLDLDGAIRLAIEQAMRNGRSIEATEREMDVTKSGRERSR